MFPTLRFCSATALMGLACTVPFLGVLLPEFATAAEFPRDPQSEAEVDQAIAQFHNPQTRLKGLERLIDFGQWRLYSAPSMFFSSGDPARDRWVTKAADEVMRCDDFETWQAALDSPCDTLRFWAVFCFPSPLPEKDPRWKSLFPRLRQLAREATENIRREAQQRLERYAAESPFLDQCLEHETAAFNILRLLRRHDYNTLSQRFEPYMLRLLNHKEETVRHDALLFIGSNPNSAPMWQVDFDRKAFNRVMELSRSPSQAERADAVYALAAMKRIDPAALRARMAELVTDSSADVRWRVPDVLHDQLDRDDVRALFDRLLHDPAPLVRYFTILTLGPEKHVPELEAIAADHDKQAAEFAAEKLTEIRAKPK